MRAAIERQGVAVLVVPGEVFLEDAADPSRATTVRPTSSIVRPDDASIAAAARLLNDAARVTILAGAGCQGAHDELIALADGSRLLSCMPCAARSGWSTTTRTTSG